MRRIVYLGRFTPATGGNTVKNEAIFNELITEIPVEKVDLTLAKKGNIRTIYRCIKAILSRKNNLIIGSAAKMRRVFSFILFQINRKTMNRSIVIIMGGQFGKQIKEDYKYQTWLKEYNQLYVETDGMIKDLNQMGIMNVSLFPNCRKKPASDIKVSEHQKPECVFFSLIQPQKGADLILEAAEKAKDIQFHFYGKVVPEFRNQFMTAVESLENVHYHGVFHGSSDEVYMELNKYDILLFPTKWDTEGVPGILVEAKIAGLVLIVSNMSYNAEFVDDGIDGYILPENTAEALRLKVEELYKAPALVTTMKRKSFLSADRFFFEKYLQNVINSICV